MKGMKSSEPTEGIVRHDIEKLKREALHAPKKKKESNLYPTEEIAEDLEHMTSNSDGSPVKKPSSTSDSSPEKSEIRYRPGIKSIPNESNETTSKANKNQWDVKLIILIILGCLIFSTLVYLWKTFPQPHSTEESINIENIMQDIKKKFATQPSLTFRVVNSALKSAVSELLETPGILVLLATEETKDTSNEFASYLAKALSKSPIVIKSDSYSSKSPEELKKDIDDSIKKNMSKNELKPVIVEDLDHLPFDAAMIFHSYCDHENAEFKRALYIMTITSDKEIQSSSSSKYYDELASERLNYAWKDSGKDQVSSLISRLTVSVAGITPQHL